MRNASQDFFKHISTELEGIRDDGLYKNERIITSQQYSEIEVTSDGHTDEVINFCANNYLGLANHPELIKAGQQALEDHGFGMASVRFICGTQDIHRELPADNVVPIAVEPGPKS